jgi:hypothetical protein
MTSFQAVYKWEGGQAEWQEGISYLKTTCKSGVSGFKEAARCNSRGVNRRRFLRKHGVARQCGFRSYRLQYITENFTGGSAAAVVSLLLYFTYSRSTFLLLCGGGTYCIGKETET